MSERSEIEYTVLSELALAWPAGPGPDARGGRQQDSLRNEIDCSRIRCARASPSRPLSVRFGHGPNWRNPRLLQERCGETANPTGAGRDEGLATALTSHRCSCKATAVSR